LWVLSLGSSGGLHVTLLIFWIGLTVWIGYHYLRQRELWTDSRLEMTHDLIEQMLGHRTRQMQGNPANLNQAQDGMLARYLNIGRRLDDWVVWLTVGISRGWLLLGVIALVPAIALTDFATAKLAISVGGVLAAFIAFERLTLGMQTLSGAQVAADRIAELLASAGKENSVPRALPSIQKDGDQQANHSPLVVGRNLTYRYPQRQRPVLNGVDLEILRGQKLLLEGSSGGGKSTLAAVITGLREPDSGLLLVDGHDFKSLGEQGWRAKVASAPQFHENHVLTETFAFNVLMGRNWPPTREDVEAAYKICYGLGLGPLLERMPGGLNQMVGDTGWQLSHGERNRLFLARALLQSADLVVLDESLAGLDPATYQQAMATIEAEADTVLMILHR
ncbi:MAG: ABC transporter ATP-binding protein, partial [Chloroflexota bacterium]